MDVSGTTALVGIIGWPVDHSLSPRMQNAAFSAAELDWLYVPLPTPPAELERALAGLAALGFVGANVTAPHKLEVARLLEADVASVNTIVVRDGRLIGSSTDAAVLEGLEADRPVVLGDGGAAHAFLDALPHALHFARRADWPPEVEGADLVVNATSEREHVLVELDAGQTLLDLPYPETATAAAARAAGARVIPGLEVLVAQGAASFEIWTGQAAPIGQMRAALGLPRVAAEDRG
jgi:shikimate dehydrogenase